MNEDEKNSEPVIDLGLALGYSNQCIQRRVEHDTGAGANAGSNLDMTFVATNPLSELVWSPQNGLSLKCADRSFSNKKPSVHWGAGPSKMVSESSMDNPINKQSFLTNPAAFNMGSEVSGRDNFTRFPASDELNTANTDQEEEMTAVEVSFLQKMGEIGNNEGEDGQEPDVELNNPTSMKPFVSARDVGDGSHPLGLDIVLASEVHIIKECETNDAAVQNATLSGKGNRESPFSMKRDEAGVFPLERLEYTAENDIQTSTCEDTCLLATEVAALKSSHEVKSNSQLADVILPRDKVPTVEQSPTNSRIQRYRLKGKSKVLSDGNVDGGMLNEEDDSHESVESCNSTGLFPNGKRQLNFDQQLIVGSKRVKRQIHESPSSSPLVKQDSSFMNWISNMMKGFLKTNEGEPTSLALTLANSSHGHDSPDQKLIASNRDRESGCRTNGFQSIFQSLYCRKEKAKESVPSNVNCPTEGFQERGMENKISDINATPLACRIATGNVYKRFQISNEKFNESTSGNIAGIEAQLKDTSIHFAANHEINKSNSAESKHSYKDGTNSNSSLGKRKMNSAENVVSKLPSEGKTTDNSGHKIDLLANLWITRCTPKTFGLLSNHVVCDKSVGEAPDLSIDRLRPKRQLLNRLGSSDDLKIGEGEEHSTEEPLHVQKYTTGIETSFGFCKIKGHHEEKFIRKVNPIMPSVRLKNSEAMASVFARRLDALKHIMPSDVTDSTAHATTTCFFCGTKGHHLQDCSGITDNELEDLLRNMNSFNGPEESPRVCIKCFELNHWAVACPRESSTIKSLAEGGASMVHECSPCKTNLNVKNEDAKKPSDGTDTKRQAAGASGACGSNELGLEKNTQSKMEEATAYEKSKSSVKLFENGVFSSATEIKLKENQLTHLHNFVNRQISDVPKGVFDAVKRLRLSRTEILKFMKSHVPLSQLGGFYLRLRLGKWEEGLGGTGYYVACISGVERESSPSKKSIPVNVGGIKCLVQSQYISNHDFLEDELMAWWGATSRSGGKIPSEEDLNSKIKEKKTLGF